MVSSLFKGLYRQLCCPNKALLGKLCGKYIPWREGLITYKCASNSYNIKSLEKLWSPHAIMFSRFDIAISFTSHELA